MLGLVITLGTNWAIAISCDCVYGVGFVCFFLRDYFYHLLQWLQPNHLFIQCALLALLLRLFFIIFCLPPPHFYLTLKEILLPEWISLRRGTCKNIGCCDLFCFLAQSGTRLLSPYTSLCRALASVKNEFICKMNYNCVNRMSDESCDLHKVHEATWMKYAYETGGICKFN